MAILPDNEFYTFEDRNYINPQVSLNEQNAFVDNLRNTQKENTNQINMQTYNLGTAVPSSVGGLTGANSYFSSRYQTPQMNSLAANLRATMQAKAMNDVLENEQAKMNKRYTEAYQKSQIRGSNGGSGGGGGGNTTNPTSNGEVEIITTKDTQGVVDPVKEANTNNGTNKQQLQYSVNGKTYYADVYMVPNSIDTDRYLWVTATTPDGLKHYRGDAALEFLKRVSGN